jgi:hypothetical protein
MISWRAIVKFFSSHAESRSEHVVNPTPGISFEEIRKFLPTFLSQGSENAFVEEITHFLQQSENRPFYTDALREAPMVFQGDGLEDLLIINLPDTATRQGKGIVLSNSCDINPLNQRLFDASLCYAPIFSLPAYLDALRKQFSEERVAAHERALRRQAITQIFFLPKGGNLENDAIVFLDRIISTANQSVSRNDLSDRRIFTLSDFGAWLFTLKISIHFCRIRDQVDRAAGVIVS